MSTKPNTNLTAIELTQSELDSVTGGAVSPATGGASSSAMAQQMQQMQQQMQANALMQAQQARQQAQTLKGSKGVSSKLP